MFTEIKALDQTRQERTDKMITLRVAPSKKCNGEYALFTSFEYDNKVVETIRALPSRYWDKNTKEWEIPTKKFSYLIESLPDYEFDITGEIDKLIEQPKIVKSVDGFEFTTTPFAHQVDGFQYGLSHDRWLLGDEQGLGKTKQVIDIACAKKLMCGYKRCLIVCGVNGLKWNWQKEIQTHSNEKGYILGQRINRAHKLTVGSTKDKLADLENLDKIPEYFIITNVESLRDKDIQTKLGDLCRTGVFWA